MSVFLNPVPSGAGGGTVLFVSQFVAGDACHLFYFSFLRFIRIIIDLLKLTLPVLKKLLNHLGTLVGHQFYFLSNKGVNSKISFYQNIYALWHSFYH